MIHIDSVDLALACWDSIREYLSNKDREAAAEQFVNILINLGFSSDDLLTVRDHDELLDAALEEYFEESEEEQLFDEDDE